MDEQLLISHSNMHVTKMIIIDCLTVYKKCTETQISYVTGAKKNHICMHNIKAKWVEYILSNKNTNFYKIKYTLKCIDHSLNGLIKHKHKECTKVSKQKATY